MRARALASVCAQTLQPHYVSVMVDHMRDGEINTRNILLENVTTRWVAWLDDDDEMLPDHLQLLMEASHGVDLVYSDYESIGASYRASFIEPAYLARTEALWAVGGYPFPDSEDWPYNYGDWGMLARLLVNGYDFKRVPLVTWRKHIHETNICGVGFEVDETRGKIGS